MRPDQVNKWLNEARFQAYLAACQEDHNRAVALYNWNAKVSAAFLEVAHHVEVLLRNAVDARFPATPAETSLSICRHDVWLTDPQILRPEARERVNEAIERIVKYASKPPTRARVVAALAFGFWCFLFSRHYGDLWKSRLVHAFPNGSDQRREVQGLLMPLLRFRNQIAHHEAVFAEDLDRHYSRFLELARLVDEEARDYIANLSRVPEVLAERPA